MQDGCITNGHLSLYLSKELTEKQVEQVEEHLNSCANCRQRLLAAAEEPENKEKLAAPPDWLVSKVSKIPMSHGKATFFARFSKLSIAAAAVGAALTLGITLYLYERTSAPSNGFRNGESVSNQAPELTAPLIQPDAIEFRWSANPGVESYLFTILNETGDVIFQKTVQKTNFVLNRKEVSFDSEKPYFWFVTAKDSRSVSVDSKIQKFYPNKTRP